MSLSRRVDALEDKRPSPEVPSHRIIQRPGQTYDEALDDYGRDRIAEGDNVVLRTIVEPTWAKERD